MSRPAQEVDWADVKQRVVRMEAIRDGRLE